MDDSKDSPSTEKDVVLFFTYVAGRMKDQKVSIPPKTSRKRKQTAPTPSSRATRQRTQKPSTMGSNDTGESSQPMDVSDEDYNMHGNFLAFIIYNLLERIIKKRTKNEAKSTKLDSEWKSKEKTKSNSSQP
ncbi:hypothetical protein Tco_0083882 [Tanacetum coccineum]